MADINQSYQNSQSLNENYLNSCFNEFITVFRVITLVIILFFGFYFYILSFIDFYNSIIGINILYMNSIYATLLTLFCPLWTQPFTDILKDLKDCYRIQNIFILLLSLIGLIISVKNVGDKFGPLIFNFILLFSGLFLALSYSESGKIFIRNCDKNSHNCNCDPCCCCPRYAIIECDSDCGNCPDCGDCVII